MIQQTKNLNNLTKQNVCVQYPVLQRYIFQTVYIVFSECRSFVKNLVLWLTTCLYFVADILSLDLHCILLFY